MKPAGNTNVTRGHVVASLAEAWIETQWIRRDPNGFPVASLAEAWIETYMQRKRDANVTVASLAEAWIEMLSLSLHYITGASPPSRRRGLKSSPGTQRI